VFTPRRKGGLVVVNQRSSQSHTLARRSRSQPCHRGQRQTLRHEVTQAGGAELVVALSSDSPFRESI